jgi:hypothetical protein
MQRIPQGCRVLGDEFDGGFRARGSVAPSGLL